MKINLHSLSFNRILLGLVASLLAFSHAAESQVMLQTRPLKDARDLAYYSLDYESARAKFLRAAAKISFSQAEGTIQSFPVGSDLTDGLFVDEFYAPPKSAKTSETRRLLVLTSGVHGIEGFTGSAIELMFLNEIFPHLKRDQLGILVTHALNPFGFKMHRRATESNINLNRNFLPQEKFQELQVDRIDHSYRLLKPLLEPQGVVAHPRRTFAANTFDLGSRLLFGEVGFQSLTQAIGQGQYRSPKGLEYGGAHAEPQVEAFTERLRLLSRDFDEIIFLDLHTGLGDRYQLHVIPSDAALSRDQRLMQNLFHKNQDSDIYQLTTGDTRGFYHTYGDSTDVLAEFSRPGLSALAMTIEFGTVGSGVIGKLKTLNRLILENQGYQYGFSSNSVRKEVMENFDELFYPKESRWRSNTIMKSRELFNRLMNRMLVMSTKSS